MELYLIAIYAVLVILWLVLLEVGNRRFEELIRPLDSKQYMFKPLYGAGFQILAILHYSYDGLIDQKRLDQAKIVYGEKYYQYYYRVHVAEKVTYVSLGIVLAPVFGLLFGNPLFCLIGLLISFLGFYYVDMKITDIIRDREFSITKDFSDMVSKMALLINAGMITREAWADISATGEGVLYQEMRISMQDMKNGASEIDAYIAFGNRCGVAYVKKFTSMLVQNLSKGNRELVDFLKAEAANSWEEKKHAVRRQGEAAANKLMLPLGLIMLGVFAMILVPIVGNMGI